MDNFDKAKNLFLDGLKLLEEKSYLEAEQRFQESLSLLPNRASTLINLSATQIKLKKYVEAKITAQKSIQFGGDTVEAYLNLGLVEKKLGGVTESIDYFDKAILLDPSQAEVWLNKGAALNELKLYQEALTSYEKAIEINPAYAEAWANKGLTLRELKRYSEAISCFENAIQIDPYIDYLLGDSIHTKMLINNWNDLIFRIQMLYDNLEEYPKLISAFDSLLISDAPDLQLKIAKIWAEDLYPLQETLPKLVKQVNKKIRVGYFSADFGDHPVSYLTSELFELHDKNQFELVALSLGHRNNNEMLKRLKKSFNQFIHVGDRSDREIALLSRELGIDIAVDLGGYTKDSRPGIFSFRAAPIQLSYIGYLGTMGTNFIDYILADPTLIPMELQEFYSEKIVYLPSYQVNDSQKKISEKPFKRDDFGLPKNTFVFCCFNNNFKILPETFSGWMRILKAVDGSVLFLYASNPSSQAYLQAEAKARGIATNRLIFGNAMPREEYLARYRSCDLFLDTTPYNAGTTASDALWAGLPVLTLIGNTFAARMAASLLVAIDLPELITHSQAEYERLAIDIAKNPKKLESLKNRLEENRLTTPLFNTPLFTKHLETAYAKIYSRYQADLPPDHLYISGQDFRH
jgi:predicted O-linked N-acetylglucosamine transferase (SPINDLY family)